MIDVLLAFGLLVTSVSAIAANVRADRLESEVADLRKQLARTQQAVGA